MLERVAELADEVAADAAVEEFADAGDGGGCGELGVDCDVAEFVFEEGESVGWRELGDEVEEEGGFAGAQEAGYDCDWDGRHDEELGLECPVVEVVEGFENEMSDIFRGEVFFGRRTGQGNTEQTNLDGAWKRGDGVNFFLAGGLVGPGLVFGRGTDQLSLERQLEKAKTGVVIYTVAVIR